MKHVVEVDVPLACKRYEGKGVHIRPLVDAWSISCAAKQKIYIYRYIHISIYIYTNFLKIYKWVYECARLETKRW